MRAAWDGLLHLGGDLAFVRCAAAKRGNFSLPLGLVLLQAAIDSRISFLLGVWNNGMVYPSANYS